MVPCLLKTENHNSLYLHMLVFLLLLNLSAPYHTSKETSVSRALKELSQLIVSAHFPELQWFALVICMFCIALNKLHWLEGLFYSGCIMSILKHTFEQIWSLAYTHKSFIKVNIVNVCVTPKFPCVPLQPLFPPTFSLSRQSEICFFFKLVE